jgi:hypothetical protein
MGGMTVDFMRDKAVRPADGIAEVVVDTTFDDFIDDSHTGGDTGATVFMGFDPADDAGAFDVHGLDLTVFIATRAAKRRLVLR